MAGYLLRRTEIIYHSLHKAQSSSEHLSFHAPRVSLHKTRSMAHGRCCTGVVVYCCCAEAVGLGWEGPCVQGDHSLQRRVGYRSDGLLFITVLGMLAFAVQGTGLQGAGEHCLGHTGRQGARGASLGPHAGVVVAPPKPAQRSRASDICQSTATAESAKEASKRKERK